LAPHRAGLPPGARRLAEVRERGPPEARVETHLHGLPGPHPGERPDVLEGPSNAGARPPERRESREILVAEPEPAPRDGRDARDGVEERGLAGAVRPDEPVHFAA